MPLATYDPHSTMRDARAKYFQVNGFGADGGYSDAWVQVKLGPLRIAIPNTEGRVRAVRYHDLHHVITGYDTNNVGEFEISAWEIGAGCKDFTAAWLLNLSGMAGGLLRAPRRTIRAFARGRRSDTLYGQDLEALLDDTVSNVQKRTKLEQAEGGSLSLTEWVLFAFASAVGLVAGTALLVLGAAAAPVLLLISRLRKG